MQIDSRIIFEQPETADEKAQLDACLDEARGNGRLALLILLRRLEALGEHHAAMARIRRSAVATAH